jgi:DNA topoisomerase-2
VVFKRKKQDLEEELSAMFPKVDDSFDYLLHTRTVDYTEERVAALFKEWEDLNEEVKRLQATGYLDMWKTDIKKL